MTSSNTDKAAGGTTEEASRARGLERVLADTYTLYLKTHNFSGRANTPRQRRSVRRRR